MIDYFDSHTHLQFAAYNEDRQEVLKRALNKGVGMINVGTTRSTSKQAADLAQNNSDKPIYSTVGIHPTKVTSDFSDDKELTESKEKDNEYSEEFFRGLLEKEGVVGIGECGLDYFRLDEENREGRENQKKLFKKHLTLAEEMSQPLMIHCRPSKGSMDAYEDLYEIIKSEAEDLEEVIIHFFVGNKEMAKKFLDLGFYFTFGGVVTFSNDYEEVIDFIPVENILCETDAPYVTPAPHRGKRNEPSYVTEVYQKMAEMKDLDLAKFKNQMIENNEKVFDIDLS